MSSNMMSTTFLLGVEPPSDVLAAQLRSTVTSVDFSTECSARSAMASNQLDTSSNYVCLAVSKKVTFSLPR
eukprot:m.596607 g.596607  ORF g.596607 m.596607 type:complete len:71 (-) comp22413_c0_seq2:112-324(-)